MDDDEPISELTFAYRGGAPTSFKRALTATGSVAAKIQPNVRDMYQDHP